MTKVRTATFSYVCRNKREPCQQKLSTFLNDFQDFGGKVSAINRIHNKDVVHFRLHHVTSLSAEPRQSGPYVFLLCSSEIEEESRETLRRSFAMEKVSFRSHKIGLGKPILSVTVVGRGLARSTSGLFFSGKFQAFFYRWPVL